MYNLENHESIFGLYQFTRRRILKIMGIDYFLKEKLRESISCPRNGPQMRLVNLYTLIPKFSLIRLLMIRCTRFRAGQSEFWISIMEF